MTSDGGKTMCKWYRLLGVLLAVVSPIMAFCWFHNFCSGCIDAAERRCFMHCAYCYGWELLLSLNKFLTGVHMWAISFCHFAEATKRNLSQILNCTFLYRIHVFQLKIFPYTSFCYTLLYFHVLCRRMHTAALNYAKKLSHLCLSVSFALL